MKGNHYVKKCSECKRVVEQCRCIGPKPVIWVVCDFCKKKGVKRA